MSPANPQRRLRLNAFTMNCLSHIVQGQWVRGDTRQREYLRLGPWVELAKLLERGRFDAIFFADVIGLYDSFEGSRDASVRRGVQVPVNEPTSLVSALALVTENLGFAFTQSVLQEQPFAFARRASTLDHLTEGRIGWNIVTSYLESAARNLGFGALPLHDDRYRRGEEYVQVLYKLWEGSWEDDAVLADATRGVYADPDKVHEINHVGEYYDVVGPHLCEPSPQRTPVLFQAGTSEAGREFAARNAEATFIDVPNVLGARTYIDDLAARARRYGREREDILVFQGFTFVTGGTEAEARAKEREIRERLDDEGTFALVSGWLGLDLAALDPQAPISELRTNASPGILRDLAEAAPDAGWKVQDLVREVSGKRFVGSVEQVADELERWQDEGDIDGVNLTYAVTPGSFADFVDGVVPILQDRGRVQRDYRPGTLREKLTDGRSTSALGANHPGAAHRRVRAAH